MTEIRITIQVPAVPVAQPRQRHAIRGKGKRQFVANYTPSKHAVNDFKATVRLAAREVYSGPPLDGALKVDCFFLMPRPKKMMWKRRPMPRVPYIIKRNDRDNLDKAVLDALTGTLWIDDGQVWEGRITKMYAAGDEQPHVEITVIQLETDDA